MEPLVKNKNHVHNGHGYREGKVATKIENVTAKAPSDLFLWSAFGMMAISLGLKLGGKDHIALFLGQWVSPILIMGLYNKLVKTHGHDQQNK